MGPEVTFRWTVWVQQHRAPLIIDGDIDGDGRADITISGENITNTFFNSYNGYLDEGERRILVNISNVGDSLTLLIRYDGDDFFGGGTGDDGFVATTLDDLDGCFLGNLSLRHASDLANARKGADTITFADDRDADGAGLVNSLSGDDAGLLSITAATGVLNASGRADEIRDFHQGQDLIEIVSGAERFDQLSIEQDRRGVVISFGAGQVRVVTDNDVAFDEGEFGITPALFSMAVEVWRPLNALCGHLNGWTGRS